MSHIAVVYLVYSLLSGHVHLRKRSPSSHNKRSNPHAHAYARRGLSACCISHTYECIDTSISMVVCEHQFASLYIGPMASLAGMLGNLCTSCNVCMQHTPKLVAGDSTAASAMLCIHDHHGPVMLHPEFRLDS